MMPFTAAARRSAWARPSRKAITVRLPAQQSATFWASSGQMVPWGSARRSGSTPVTAMSERFSISGATTRTNSPGAR